MQKLKGLLHVGYTTVFAPALACKSSMLPWHVDFCARALLGMLSSLQSPYAP
jgi:hypothetical protein